MNPSPREVLDTMLGYLGFICEIKEFPSEQGLTLQVYTPEADRLIGPRGETLEDIQLLLNRLLQSAEKDAPRIQVDIEHHREMRDDLLVQRTRRSADIVRQTGRPFHLPPMNAYDRRLVHNAFASDPEVMTWSPKDDSRIKRITLKRREPSRPK